MLPVHGKDENNINGNSFYMRSQETETDRIPIEFKISCGPEQGGSTDSDFLVEENYLGPTNLNWMNNDEEDKRQINNISCTHIEGTKKKSNFLVYTF